MRIELGKRYQARNGSIVYIKPNLCNCGCGLPQADVAPGLSIVFAWNGCTDNQNPGWELVAPVAEPVVIKPRAGYAPIRKNCPTVYRVRTMQEMASYPDVIPLGISTWQQFEDRMTEKAQPSPHASFWMLQIDGNVVEVPDVLVEVRLIHTWHDNGGLLRTWCSRCDCDGEWDRLQYKYVESAGRKNSNMSTEEVTK